MPFPQLALRATVHSPSADIDVVNVHIPNGSRHGWNKVYSLVALAKTLEGSPSAPRVLGGDFNEPQQFVPGGGLVTFAQLRRGSGGAGLGRFRDRHGREHDLSCWDKAVRGVFEGTTKHGLRHVREILGLDQADIVTHMVRGSPRYFDHLFLSSHFRPTGYCCLNSVREKPRYSDHSAVYADADIEPGSPVQ